MNKAAQAEAQAWLDSAGSDHESVLEQASKKAHELINSALCWAGLREEAQAWLDSIGTENEAVQTKKFIAELEADVLPIDTLISYSLESDKFKEYFGADTAAAIGVYARARKAAGWKYCCCPACAAAKAILDLKEDLLQ